MATRIKEKYLAEAIPALKQKFGYKNVMEIPKLSKIVINMGRTKWLPVPRKKRRPVRRMPTSGPRLMPNTFASLPGR